MSKRLNLFWIISSFFLSVNAQWTERDSLELKRLLNNDGEIKLNRDIIKDIDFDPFMGKPMVDETKPALEFDATLPKALPDRGEIKLSLRPYTANTKFNYDPIYQKKIAVNANTWKSNKFGHLTMRLIPTNWAQSIYDPTIRRSVEEIEATGLRYRPLSERANNMAVGGWGSSKGNGISGMDFDVVFTRNFWDAKGRKRKARTLDVLQSYGDSVTVLIKEEIKKVIIQ